MRRLISFVMMLVMAFGLMVAAVAPVDAHPTSAYSVWKSQDNITYRCRQGQLEKINQQDWYGYSGGWHWNHQHVYQSWTGLTC